MFPCVLVEWTNAMAQCCGKCWRIWNLGSGWREKASKWQSERIFGWWKEVRSQWGKMVTPKTSLLKATTSRLCNLYLSFWIDKLDYTWLKQPGLRDARDEGLESLKLRYEEEMMHCWYCTGEHIPPSLDMENHFPLTRPQMWPRGQRGCQLYSFYRSIHSTFMMCNYCMSLLANGNRIIIITQCLPSNLLLF